MKKYKLKPFDETLIDNNSLNILLEEEIKSSSSNNVYNVTIYDEKISCNCPAGGKRTFCKHMLLVIKKNKDFLEKTTPELYAKLQSLIALKQNHKGFEKEYKELADNLIFVNRIISEKAYDNQISRDNYKIKRKELCSKILASILKSERKNQLVLLEFLREIGAYTGLKDNLILEEFPKELTDFINENLIVCKKEKNVFSCAIADEYKSISRALYSSLLNELYPKNEYGYRDSYDDRYYV